MTASIPKRLVPPYRVVEQNQRYTSGLSAIAHKIKKRTPKLAKELRKFPRKHMILTRASTGFIIIQGYYDIYVMAHCALICEDDDECSN